MELVQDADRSKWIAHSKHNIKCFTKGDIERMTNNYRTTLGRGAFGEVYEGVLEDESMVAVKRLIGNVEEKFANELTVHRQINHNNAVRLIGYCVEENALMFVMEYVSNGNLSDFLHDNNRPIPLDIRLKIAIECAEALAYMHSNMYTQVIHGDIKPGNILLDSNFHAKLSDFGISRLPNTYNTLHTENVIGSIGYMDPLFASDGLLTVKYDVYSFGVVLLEMITRKKATTVVGNINIVYAFTDALARRITSVREMFDAEIASKNNMKVLEGVAKLAGKCLSMERDKRPDMIDVAERLRVLQISSHQDQGWMPSWVRKSSPALPDSVTIGANILLSDVYRQFSFAEIKAATNKFDESLRVGEGGSGTVYRGQINGRKTNVAIKYMKKHQTGVTEFYTEIEMMSKHRHRRLVPLIGYCIEDDERILVYEYMTCGSLHDQLHGTQKPSLTWKQRIKISIGAARGLRYLHEQQIIHGNLKTKKILLDEEWVAKITDLSLSRDGTLVETSVVKAMGYVDPEYMMTARLTEKSDVYSFGVVLFEILSAQLPYGFSIREEQEQNLLSLNKLAKTAFKCVAPEGIDRPSMGDVVSDLEHALQLQESADVSERDVVLDLEHGLQLQESADASEGDMVSDLEHALQLHESAGASEGAMILPSRPCRQFCLAEMEIATNNFDKSLLIDYSGLFGRVYNGKIDGAAITLVDVMHVYSIRAFHSLIEILSKLGHVHLVPLIGYCQEQEMALMVYEYVAGENLGEHLYGTRKQSLNWIQRMETCIGVARGLQYLHGLKLTHGAVRTSNIILDEKCLAKITNLAPPSNLLDTHTAEFCGTDGYSDPEYLRTGLCTEKSDVYCLGLVLLEVLFARPVIECHRIWEKVAPSVNWACQCPDTYYLHSFVDPHLEGKIHEQCLNMFLNTARKCIADKGIDRPTIRAVLCNLEYALQLNGRLESGEVNALQLNGRLESGEVNGRLESGENRGSMSGNAMDEGR